MPKKAGCQPFRASRSRKAGNTGRCSSSAEAEDGRGVDGKDKTHISRNLAAEVPLRSADPHPGAPSDHLLSFHTFSTAALFPHALQAQMQNRTSPHAACWCRSICSRCRCRALTFLNPCSPLAVLLDLGNIRPQCASPLLRQRVRRGRSCRLASHGLRVNNDYALEWPSPDPRRFGSRSRKSSLQARRSSCT